MRRTRISDLDLYSCLSDATSIDYTTVRGPFRMAPVPMLRLPPFALEFLDGREPWGAYYLVYEQGASKDEHTDPPPYSGSHERLVVLLRAADLGGVLVVDGKAEPLQAGEGVIFRPDVQPHLVSRVELGTRIAFTVGALTP